MTQFNARSGAPCTAPRDAYAQEEGPNTRGLTNDFIEGVSTPFPIYLFHSLRGKRPEAALREIALLDAVLPSSERQIIILRIKDVGTNLHKGLQSALDFVAPLVVVE